MAITSATIDVSALKVAGDGASKYITSIDSNNGIQVHAENNTTEHYVQINADGMEVFKDDDSKAFFGETVRIGRENQASIVINDSNIIGYGDGGKEFFNFGNSTTVISTIKTHYIVPFSYAYKVSYPLTAILPSMPNNNEIRVYFRIVNNTGGSNRGLASFFKGSNKTQLVTINAGNTSYEFTITYNGSDTFLNIRSQSVIPDSYKIEIYVKYAEDVLAPSYELGVDLSTTGGYAYAEGVKNTAGGNYSHAEGYASHADGNYSHTEGSNTRAEGSASHAEGWDTDASGDYSHSEGRSTTAEGNYSHAEGYNASAKGNYSHAEGYGAQRSSEIYPFLVLLAEGNYSHAEGYSTRALGDASHSQNYYTVASHKAQTSLGTYNVQDTTPSTSVHASGVDYGNYALIVGNGTANDARSNALAVTWDGNVHIDLAGYATSDTTDKKIYDALDSLGWISEVTA